MRHGGRFGGQTAIMTLDNHDLKYKRLQGPRAAAMPLGVHGRRRRRGGVQPALMGVVSWARSLPQTLVLTLALALCAGVWIGLSALPPRQQKADTAPGLAMLETLEQRDPQAVDAVLQERAGPTMWDDGAEEFDLDLDDVWGTFQNYMLLGDSRAVGFYYYEFLDTNRVLADGGDTILKIEEHMDEIVAMQPRYVFLCYGINDIGIGFWPTPEEYSEAYMECIAALKERLPDAVVVVAATLPARDPAFELNSAWYNIPEYNVDLAAACEENGVIFADNSAIAEAHADLWDVDGIHLRPDFYPYWGKNLLEAVWKYEKESGTV